MRRHTPIRLAIMALALLAALLPQRSPARSQDVFHLLKDMNPASVARATTPQDTAVLGDAVYFITDDRAGYGNAQLWRTDGTEVGTKLVVDFPNDTLRMAYQLRPGGDRLYFLADSNAYGIELWTSDGTATGTHMVADLTPGSESSFPDYGGDIDEKGHFPSIAMGGFFYFSTQGRDLWRTDGTEAGTKKVFDQIEEGISDLHVFNNKLYILGTYLDTLWVSDATKEGTQKLADLSSTFYTSFIENNSYLTSYNNKLYFLDQNNTKQTIDLWSTDGTPAGTSVITSFQGHIYNPHFPPVVVNNKLSFLIETDDNIELWTSNGTAGGTNLVAPLPSGKASMPLLVNNKMLFIRQSNTSSQAELWLSDGTLAGTQKITTFTTSSDFKLRTLGNKAILCADKCWSSDGTAAGTTEIADSNILWFNAASQLGKVLISPVKSGYDKGMMARTDGTTVGTSQFFLDVTPASTSVIGTTMLGNTRFIATSTSLWESDGTTAATKERTGISSLFPKNAVLTAMVPFKGSLLLREEHQDANYTYFSGLWRSNGTPTGTSLIKNFTPPISSMLVVNNVLYMIDQAGTLWGSDGTAAGTTSIATKLSYPRLFAVGTDLIITTDQPSSGTNSTTSVLKLDTSSNSLVEIVPTSDTDWNHANVIGKSAYWHIVSGTTVEWWRYDQGASKPKQIATVTTEQSALYGGITTAWQNTLALVYIGEKSSEIWQSDGTTSGTMKLVTIPGTIGDLAVAGPYIYFEQKNADSKRQLWRTDGTKAGTIRLKDAVPQMPENNINIQKAIGSTLYFSTYTPDTGTELWRSDGTAAGTTLYADINPGVAGSDPNVLLEMNGALLAQATTAQYGRELYIIDAPVGSKRLYLPLAQH